MSTCQIANLPKVTNTTGEICDKYGNKFKYDPQTNTWIQHGYIPIIPIVTEDTNGLITPNILSIFDKIRKTLEPIASKQSLKINPGVDAYWYYFRSSDKCVKFRTEDEHALRIEIDSGRLYRLLASSSCKGLQGKIGLDGQKGKQGAQAPDENYYKPNISRNTLNFAAYTATPLVNNDQIILTNNHVPDISIRIYEYTLPLLSQLELKSYDQLQHFAINYNKYKSLSRDFQKTRDLLINHAMGITKSSVLNELSDVLVFPDGTIVSESPIITILVDPIGVQPHRIINDSEYDINIDATIDSINFDVNTNIVSGTIVIDNDWPDELCFKSCQRGLDGVTGDNGESTIKIVKSTIDNSNVISTCPIINARFDIDDNVIYTLCSDITNIICVNNVKLHNKSGIISDDNAIDATFASAIPTIDSCKSISSYVVELPPNTTDDLELELYHWKPQPGCVTKRHFNRHNFNWFKLVNTESCVDGRIWYDDDMQVREPKYPYEIERSNSPESDPCVQEDFFYCPNIQLSGCINDGTSSTNTPNPNDHNVYTAEASLTSKSTTLRANVRTISHMI